MELEHDGRVAAEVVELIDSDALDDRLVLVLLDEHPRETISAGLRYASPSKRGERGRVKTRPEYPPPVRLRWCVTIASRSTLDDEEARGGSRVGGGRSGAGVAQ